MRGTGQRIQAREYKYIRRNPKKLLHRELAEMFGSVDQQ